MDAVTLTLNGTELSADYFPPIQLDGKYEIGLILLETFNSIPNVDKSNNMFYYDDDKIISIKPGSYEIEDIAEYILNEMKLQVGSNDNQLFTLIGNMQTLHSEIRCKYSIDFTKENSIGRILGFSKIKLKANEIYESDSPVDIMKVNIIRVECNISGGSYSNNTKNHSIAEIPIDVEPGYKLTFFPSFIIYYPVITQSISNLTVTLTDQEGRKIDFRNELITIRLHLKKCR